MDRRLTSLTSYFTGSSIGILLLFSNVVYSMENRIALVIGNGAYQGLPPLHNPVNDAEDMATQLIQLGFEVYLYQNMTRASMRKAMRDFGHALRSTQGVGLFYYAGHGVQVDGENYLIPVQADLHEALDVPDQALSAKYVLNAMKAAGNDMNIIILDACRDNPFSTTRSLSQGLARMNAPRGSLIAYATAPGNTALDGEGRNGTYTKYLLKYINQPNLTLEQVFKRVRADVEQETGRKQTPWEESSLRGDFYFIDTPNIQQVEPKTEIHTPDTQHVGSNTEIEFWNNIKNTDNSDYFQAYIEQYGDQGLFTRIAKIKVRLAKLKPITRSSQSTSTPAAKPETPLIQLIFEPKMTKIPSGTFQMGSPTSVKNRRDNEHLHTVEVNEFWMSKTEVTFAEYDVFAEKSGYNKPDDEGWGRGNRPVINISWHDAVAYTKWLSRKTGKSYRLPTEAEWEYAARAGTKTLYSWGHSLGHSRANCDECGSRWDGRQTAPVGSFSSNEFGLYDMHGNVWEWTCSGYDKAYGGGELRCIDSRSGPSRVVRGGSWLNSAGYNRSAVRFRFGPEGQYDNLGLRLALDR